MALRHWSAPLALIVFQLAPVSVVQQAGGGIDIGFGYGPATYNQRQFNCSGNTTHKRTVDSKVASGSVSYTTPSGSTRITALAGHVKTTAGPCLDAVTERPSSECYVPLPLEGAFAGATVSFEGGKSGGGLGLVAMPQPFPAGLSSTATSRKHALKPALSLRIGDLEGASFRWNVRQMLIPGEIPMSSLGFGFTSSRYPGDRGFIGLGAVPYDVGDGSDLVLMGNAAIPIGQRGDVTIGGYYGAGDARAVTVGVKVRVRGKR
jgi:hypothetical protein